MGSHSMHFCLYCIILILICFANCSKLNERRILLPYNNGVATNFTLEATDGDACYQWSSSRVDVASVESVDTNGGCSRRAKVSVVSRVAKRQSTIVLATNTATGSVIRCDVEVDVIKEIEIITTTREIVLEDLPEILEMTLTSIGGIQFEWTLTPVDILRYRTWSSSSYVAPESVQYWESRDAKGALILIEGIRTGSAKVKVRVMGDAYQDVKPYEIVLHVVANLGLIPSNDVYLMAGAKLEFKAEIAKQGPRVALKLPSAQYYLQILDPTIAKLDEATSQVTALKEGHTSLCLRDLNVIPDEGSRQPVTDIHVMRPSYINIQVSPGENFALCEFTTYEITLTIHDDWHHRLYPAENLNLKVNFPSNHFYVNNSTSNGTWHIVRTINKGNCKINAQLLGAGSIKLSPPLEFTQDVIIYQALTLSPTLIMLPWIPSEKPSYTVFVTANGGTGHYRWLSNNTLVATATYRQEQSSRVTVTTRSDGESLLTCQDVHNSVFSANMRVLVKPVADIEILPAIVETHVGGNIILPIAVYGYSDDARTKKHLFNDCSRIPLKVEIVEKTRFRYEENENIPGVGPRSCRSLSFPCISPGNSRVWISYDSIENESPLKTTTLIGCHTPLKCVHPENFAVLALGTSIDIAFEGGPRSWTLHPEGHYARLTPEDPSLISYSPILDRYRYNKDLHVFRVTCLKLGETTLELVIGNLASPTLPNPASSKAQVNIICGQPASLIIKPKLKGSCPLNAPQDSVFPVEKNQNVEIQVEVRDDAGRAFYNISNFNINWSVEGDGTLEISGGVREEVNGAKGFRILTRNYNVLQGSQSNVAKLKAQLNGYKQDFKEKFSIKREIELSFVDKANVKPEKVSIFNHPKNKAELYIRKGSGYFGIELSNNEYINTSFQQHSKQIKLTPKHIGRGVIVINDLCLTSYGATEVPFAVVEVSEIRVNMVDKFQVDTTVEASLVVIDNNGEYLDSKHHDLLNLIPIVSNPILTVGNLSIADERTSVFQVKGEKLGSTSLNFVSYATGINIESSLINIQIFAQLRIIPSNVTIIVGNQLQMTCVGGPQPQRSIEYSIIDGEIARVESNGLLVGSKLGKTRLLARVLSVENVEYSRAEIFVHVVALNTIKIASPSSQLQIGASLPMFLMGANEHETPFSFGASKPPLKITWSVSNENVAIIERVFENAKIVESEFDAISIRLRAKSLGTVSIKVTVEVISPTKEESQQQIVDNRILTSTAQINVFPAFGLLSEDNNILGRVILMSPQSEFTLVSNRVGEADTEYKLLNATAIELSSGNERYLKAGEKSETASLMVRTKEKFGITQTSTYGIRVDQISYMVISPITSFPLVDPVNVFPIGSLLEVRVNFFDNIGSAFDATRSQIRWSLSRDDLISISRGSQNTTLRIRSLKEGRTVVQVYEENSNVFDYFAIDVDSVLEPSNLLMSVCEVVCLSTKLTGTGSWFVSNPLLADVDQQHGIFVARTTGQTHIGWNSSTGLSTYTHLKIVAPKDLLLDTNNFNGVTNTLTHSLPIIIVSDTDSAIRKSCASLRIDPIVFNTIEKPFECDFSLEGNDHLNDFWETNVLFDVTNGQWVCQFTPKQNIDYTEMAKIDTNVTISVMMMIKHSRDDSIFPSIIKTVTVPFLPAFYLTPNQIVLSPLQPDAKLVAVSVPHILRDISLVSSKPEIIGLSSEIVEDSLKINVHLKDLEDVMTSDVSNLYITLNSKLTKQSERIPVQIKLTTNRLLQPSGSSILTLIIEYSGIIFMCLITGLVLLFSIWYASKSFKRTPSVPRVPIEVNSSPFRADPIHSPSSGHRTLNYSISPSSSSSSVRTPVGRPLYSLRNT